MSKPGSGSAARIQVDYQYVAKYFALCLLLQHLLARLCTSLQSCARPAICPPAVSTVFVPPYSPSRLLLFSPCQLAVRTLTLVAASLSAPVRALPISAAKRAQHHSHRSTRFKVVLVGNSGAGKTNLVSRYTKGRFDDRSTATVGAEIATKVCLSLSPLFPSSSSLSLFASLFACLN